MILILLACSGCDIDRLKKSCLRIFVNNVQYFEQNIKLTYMYRAYLTDRQNKVIYKQTPSGLAPRTN